MQTTEKNRVEVVIDGKEYTVVGTESEQYISRIAKMVDETISLCGASAVSFTMKMVLASLNLADELEKKNGRIAELEKLLETAEEKNSILQRNLNAVRNEAKKNNAKTHNDSEANNEQT